jgi:hypothetical protein
MSNNIFFLMLASVSKNGIIKLMKRGPELSLRFPGPITDSHMHPRVYDDAKAGVDIYSATALRSGFTQGLAMLNEFMRMPDPNSPDGTSIEPFPVNTAERLAVTANIVSQQARMRMGLMLLIDPGITHLNNNPEKFTARKISKEFNDPRTSKYAAGAKIFAAESFGGFTIRLDDVLPIASEWNKAQPNKTMCLHLEDGDVGEILRDWPDDIPAHICHVSSRQELEAIIEAKEAGKDVTCEATPHHMFLTEYTREVLGAFGCMKPTLKPKEDQKFLWDNLEYIDIFASDCAPHRKEDKVGPDGKDLPKPAFGVTNHDVFLPLFFQAILEGKLTEQDLYDRLVTNPIKRFNLPPTDSYAEFLLTPISVEEASQHTAYGQNPFITSPETPKMRGRIVHLAPEVGSFVISHGVWTNPSPKRTNLIQF